MSVGAQVVYHVFDFIDGEGRRHKRMEWVCVDSHYRARPAPTLAEIFFAIEVEFPNVDEADIGIFAERGKLIVTDMPEYIGIPGSDGWVEWRNERVRITPPELRRAALCRFSGLRLDKIWLTAGAYPALKMGKLA